MVVNTSVNTFNLYGSDDGQHIKTTYADHGYTVLLKVGTIQSNSIACRAVTVGNISMKPTVLISGSRTWAVIQANLTNRGSIGQRANVAVHSDTQIDTNDYASMESLTGNRGFRAYSSLYSFTYYVKTGETPVDTYWYGHYYERMSYLWQQISSTSLSGIDSGLAFSWQNRTVPPHGSIVLSTIVAPSDVHILPQISINSFIPSIVFINETITFSGSVFGYQVPESLTIFAEIDGPRLGRYTWATGLEDKSTFTYNLAATTLGLGTHEIVIWVADRSGMISENESYEIIVIPLPRTRFPTPTISNSPSPTISNSPSPTIRNSPSPTISNSPSPTISDSPSPTISDSPSPSISDSPPPSTTQRTVSDESYWGYIASIGLLFLPFVTVLLANICQFWITRDESSSLKRDEHDLSETCD